MLRCVQALRFALYPFVNFFLVYFIKEIKTRKLFEKKNTKGFNQLGIQAEIAFEVSSEGELEQTLPFILHNLEKKRRVELIFSSKSVEHKCLDLKNQYEDQLMIYRLPLITGSSCWINGQNLSMWMTSKKLVLCRYDFFPELLLLKNVKLYLTSATLINRKTLNESYIKRWYWQQVYNKFEIILVACQSDMTRFIEIGINPEKIKILEARVIQISNRVQKCNLINSSFIFSQLTQYLESFPIEKRMIIGSAWEVDLNIFDDINLLNDIHNGDFSACILPHNLDSKSISTMITKLEQIISRYGLKLKVINVNKNLAREEIKNIFQQLNIKNSICIISVSGILCELYAYFRHAYVGGGHGRSVHSLLEPYLADALVYCGPKVLRSTEYEIIKEKSNNYIEIISDLRKLFEVIGEKSSLDIDKDTRLKLINSTKNNFEGIVNEL
jgi:3-deoxy-D-manno-octulosonic-acid transferase